MATDQRAAEPKTRLVQIGWQNDDGVMCDCPVYEVSPHANSKPVYREEKVGG